MRLGILYRIQSNKEPLYTQLQHLFWKRGLIPHWMCVSDIPRVPVCVCSRHSFSYTRSSKIKAGKTNDILFRIQGKFFLPPCDFLTLWTLIDTSTSASYLVPFVLHSAVIWWLPYEQLSSYIIMAAAISKDDILPWEHAGGGAGRHWHADGGANTLDKLCLYLLVTETAQYHPPATHTHTLLSFFNPSVLGSVSRTAMVLVTPLSQWGKTSLSFPISAQIHLPAPSHQKEKPRRQIDDGQLGRHLE